MKIRTKRIYDDPEEIDGYRILVDRIWARGVSKQKARIDYWAKDIAPSTGLRQWYRHDPDKWPEFKRRYFAELDANPEAIEAFLRQLPGGTVTFLFSSKEQKLNNARALKEYVESNQ